MVFQLNCSRGRTGHTINKVMKIAGELKSSETDEDSKPTDAKNTVNQIQIQIQRGSSTKIVQLT